MLNSNNNLLPKKHTLGGCKWLLTIFFHACGSRVLLGGSTHSFLCLVISLSRVGPVSTLDWDLTLHVPQRRENLPSRDTQGEGNGR